MGPPALFDKSFLQSLNLDESVWFAHFFLPAVAPLFYVETLADLEKAVKEGRTPEDEVGIIAGKFPEGSGTPCAHHAWLVENELLGDTIPMQGQIVLPGGRPVRRDGKLGVLFDYAPESEALSRWHRRRFLSVERDFAKAWRSALAEVDLQSVADALRKFGVTPQTCSSLEEAKAAAMSVVRRTDNPFSIFAMLAVLCGIQPDSYPPIVDRWREHRRFAPLPEHAPFSAHVLTVELFFQIAVAAGHIGTGKPSNRVDIAYLNYLPFCDVFISTDRLHRRCAPLFLRPNQEFVWGEDLKADLARINAHFMPLSEETKERGLGAFAAVPPELEGSLVRRLYEKYCGGANQEEAMEASRRDPERDAALVQHLREWDSAPEAAYEADGEPEMVSIQRRIRHKKGSWWQLPKDLEQQ